MRRSPSPFGRNGAAVVSPDLAGSTDDSFQENDVVPEDWLEATKALGFKVGAESIP